MATHIQLTRRASRHFVQICGCLLLRGHGAQIGHVEIFLPAHDGGIRTAKRDVGCAVGQTEGHGGKLLLAHLIRSESKIAQAAGTKPRARAHREQQIATTLLVPARTEHALEVLRTQQLVQRDAAHGACARELRPDMRVGEPGEHEAVDGAKRPFVERVHALANVFQEVPSGLGLQRQSPLLIHSASTPFTDLAFGPFYPLDRTQKTLVAGGHRGHRERFARPRPDRQRKPPAHVRTGGETKRSATKRPPCLRR